MSDRGTCAACGGTRLLLCEGLCWRCGAVRDEPHARHYRAIASLLGLDPSDGEAVERRVKELHDDPTRFVKLSPDTCECELRDRAWNPATKRCESCGRKYERTNP